MAWSARKFTTNLIQNPVTQVAHGFTVGEILTFDGTEYIYAVADALVNAEVIGMVSSVIDADHFNLAQVGFITSIATTSFDPPGPATPGVLYYLSESQPGKLTSTPPAAPTDVILPLFEAITGTTGYFHAQFPGATGGGGGGGGLTWTTVTTNTSMAVNNGYIINGGGSLNMLLPAVAAVGDPIEIVTLGVNGCVITQNVLQSLNIVDATSTIGVSGTTTLQTTGGVLSGSIRLICVTANTAWKCVSGTGIWNPA